MKFINRNIWFVISIIVIIVIAINIFYYSSLYNQQIDSNSVLIENQAKVCETVINEYFENLNEDLSIFFSNENIAKIFENQDLQSLEIKNIRRFFMKYKETLREVFVYNETGNNFYFSINKNNYFTKSYSENIIPPQIQSDSVYYNGNDVLQIYLKRNTVYGNFSILFTIKIKQFITTKFSQFHIKEKNFQSLYNVDGNNIVTNLSNENILFSDITTIRENISKNLYYTGKLEVIENNNKQKTISTIYPVNIMGVRFGIIFSEKTSDIFYNSIQKALIISIITISIFLFTLFLILFLVKESREKEKNLTRINKELEELTLISTHDLQEPLRKIQVFGDRLRVRYAEHLGDTGKDYIERMQTSASRMQTMLNELLTYSLLSTKINRYTMVDLNNTMKDVMADLETMIEKEGARITISKLPVIEAVPMQMQQLLQNLLSNSIKFHKQTQPPIVKINAEIVDNQRIKIIIIDNGIGFDMSFYNKIFRPFQRLQSRASFEGTGIGLAICKRIVDLHNGTILAKSTLGVGTRFEVELPITQKK